jgi:mitogen-activated protein kinase 1/3
MIIKKVILLQNYTTAVDVWSLGCIFAELLGMIQENVSDYKLRKPLFPGDRFFYIQYLFNMFLFY